MDGSKDVRSAILDAAAAAGGDPGDHPSFSVLAAYRASELTEEDADRVQEHLARCGTCPARLLELAAFEDEEAEVDELEIERELRRLERRLAHEAVAAGDPTPPRPSPAAVPAARGRAWALAASLLVSFGLGVLLALVLPGRPAPDAPAPFPGPAAPPLIAELAPELGPTRSAEPDPGAEPLRVPRGRGVSLILHQVAEDEGDYLARVTPPAGEPYTAPLEPGPTGLFALTLPADAPPGGYRIDLIPGGTSGEPSAVYRFDLAHD